MALAGSVAMWLPFLAAADSQVQLGAAGASLHATARVKFKIIIPAVLSLDTPGDAARAAQTVTLFSNNRSVALAATVGSSEVARKTVLLNSAARKVIARDVVCAPGAVADASRIVCTACMP